MSRLVKFFWFLSIIIFLITLLFVYAYLPARVGVHAGPGGIPDEYVDRSTFFYVSIAIFLLANASLYILRLLLQKTWMQSSEGQPKAASRLSLKQDVADWLLAFASVLNIFFILGMTYLGMFNNADGLDLGLYTPFVYAGPILMVLLFMVLVYIFMKKRPA